MFKRFLSRNQSCLLTMLALGVCSVLSQTAAAGGLPNLRLPPPDFRNRLPAPPPVVPGPPPGTIHAFPIGIDSIGVHVQKGDSSGTVMVGPNSASGTVVIPIGGKK